MGFKDETLFIADPESNTIRSQGYRTHDFWSKDKIETQGEDTEELNFKG